MKSKAILLGLGVLGRRKNSKTMTTVDVATVLLSKMSLVCSSMLLSQVHSLDFIADFS